VPHGYVVIRVDSRGAAKSPDKLDANSPQEFADFHDAIEWAGAQPWCNGKVGLLGISYYACGQWMVAAGRPKHLAAILPWQGTCDFYRGAPARGVFSATASSACGGAASSARASAAKPAHPGSRVLPPRAFSKGRYAPPAAITLRVPLDKNRPPEA
jgi:putative CocE/NonD family hydrolase